MKAFVMLLLIPTFGYATSSTIKQEIPDWVQQIWHQHTQGSGIWITDNSSYRSDQEPYDAYGMQWEWGIGKSSIKGRLYCIRDGMDVGTVWQFLNFWDPESQSEQMIQIGSNGTVGKGNFSLQANGSTKSVEHFITPDGNSFEAGHHSWFEEGQFHTQSYDIRKGQWTKRRKYVWKRQESLETKVPEVYHQISSLIGEWEAEIRQGTVQMRFQWADNQRMITYQSTRPFKAGEPEQLEASGIITYHGVSSVRFKKCQFL